MDSSPQSHVRARSNLLLIFVFLIAALAGWVFAQSPTYNQQLVAQSGRQAFISSDVLGRYQTAVVFGAGAVMAIVVLAILAGYLLGLEELKQWGRAELGQALVTVFLAGVLLAVIGSADIVLQSATLTIQSPCISNQVPTGMASASKLTQYAGCYMENLQNLAGQMGSDTIRQSIELTAKAYSSNGIQTDTEYTGYFGYNWRPEANLRLDSEIKGIEFELLSKYMVSFEGQRYFLANVVPVVGPVLLMLGLILRTLFFTRRLGGLLIATGCGLLIILPATYLLSWLTLQVAVYGPAAVASSASSCPVECKIQAPMAYDLNANPDGKLMSGQKTSAGLDALNTQRLRNLPPSAQPYSLGDEKNWRSLTPKVQTCYPDYPIQKDASGKEIPANRVQAAIVPDTQVPAEASQNCPADCRFLPLPRGLQCDEAACDLVPIACKAIRAIPNQQQNDCTNGKLCSSNSGDSNYCPEYCKKTLPEVRLDSTKVVPSANGNACTDTASGAADCSTCPLYCRAYFSDVSPAAPISLKSECASCAGCIQKNDPLKVEPYPAGTPDCMTGIPTLLNGRCDDDNVCGKGYAIGDVLDNSSGANPSGWKLKIQACPVDCRVYYNASAGENKYQDPFFIRFCQSDVLKQACASCPDTCKAPVRTALGLKGDPPAPIQLAPVGSNKEVVCSIPPAFMGTTGGAAGCTAADAASASSCQMETASSGDCGRCPLSCRFANPSSINNPYGDAAHATTNANALQSFAHYAQDCAYVSDTQQTIMVSGHQITVPGDALTYSGACNTRGFPSSGWKSFTSEKMSDGTGTPSPAAPACVPANAAGGVPKVYRRVEIDANALCPLFISDGDPGVVLAMPTATNPHIQAQVVGNPNVSAECASADAIKFCLGSDASGKPYCPDGSSGGKNCLVDRAVNGPFVCALDNIKNQYSGIGSNNLRCGGCFAQNSPTNSTGPQCQVLLQYASSPGVTPAGCDANKCDPGASLAPTDSSSNSCNGFCYPRLQEPTGATVPACGPYDSGKSGDAARPMASCAACPIECRYDYMTASGPAMSEEAKARCGLGSTMEGYLKECDYACIGRVPKDSQRNGWATDCINDNNFECTVDANANDFWIRRPPGRAAADPDDYCNQNMVEHGFDDSHANPPYWADFPARGEKYSANSPFVKSGRVAAGTLANANWYKEQCSLPAGTDFIFSAGVTGARCTLKEKYKGFDEMVSRALSRPAGQEYYECGELNLPDAQGNARNPDYNLCGTLNVLDRSGQPKVAVSACNLDPPGPDPAKPASCAAQYNARALACLPDASYASQDPKKNVLGTSTQPITASQNCQQCPMFCRIDDSTFSCSNSAGGLAPQCAPPSAASPSYSCDLRTTTGSVPPQPPGYCGVSGTVFKLPGSDAAPDASQCARPATGSGVGCPARCRLLMPDGSVPAGCDGGEIGDACKNIENVCRGGPANNPCATCAACDTDCLSKPYVRATCADLCAPDELSGAAGSGGPKGADAVLAAWGGADGNPQWKALGALGIPALLLPILCILLTLSFIRSLSPILGGDIEIPGILKLI